MKPTIDDPQGYIAKLRPCYTELFRTAHAIVGNAELAEFVLKKAVYEAWQRRGEWRERMSFREGLSQTVRMVALAELQSIRSVGSFERDWSLLTPDPAALTPDQRQIMTRLQRESPDLNRALMLYYGCGLRIGQIAQVMNKKPAQVRDMIYMLRTRLERSRMRIGGGKHLMEDNLERLLLAMLQQSGADVPDSGVVLRAFERDAAAAPKPRRSAGKIVAAAFIAAFAIVCALLFWLVAILMEPSARPVQDTALAAQTQAAIAIQTPNLNTI